MRLYLSLLGGFRCGLETGQAVEFRLKKAEAIVAYLSVRRGQRTSRETLATLLWGELPADQARHNLRQTLFVLKQALPAPMTGALIVDGDAVALDPILVDVDVSRFEDAAAKQGIDALMEATSLYAGDFLEGFAVDDAGFEEWLRSERDRLHELALEACARLLAEHMKEGTVDAAVQTALRLLVLDPLQEVAHRALMRLYLRQGRRAAALHQYQICVDVVKRDLDTDPEEATRALYEEILPPRPAQAVAVGPDLPAPTSRGRGDMRRPRGRRFATTLIGRASEVATCRRALRQARRGRGSVLTIVGEAGIGKTRVVDELISLVLRRGARILKGRAFETAQVLPFGPWVDVLRSDPTVLSEARALAQVWQVELMRLFPDLGSGERVEATDDALRLFQAVGHLVARLGLERPLVVVLEDLHWADEMSLRLLAYLARQVERAAVLFVVTARDEQIADAPLLERTLEELRQSVSSTTVTLAPLSREDTAALVRSLGGTHRDAAALARVQEHVWHVSEGHPLLVVETMRSLGEPAGAPDEPMPALPGGVREMVAARLSRLGGGSRHLAEIAGVIGREFEFTLLQRAGGLSDHDTARAVEELVRRRILHGVGEKLDFTHDRIREVAGGDIPAPRRRAIHRLVAESIESIYIADLDAHSPALAAHYRESEVWDKTVVYTRRAGGQAAARLAFRQAVEFFEQALAALARLPESAERQALAIDLRFDLRGVLYQLNEFPTIVARLREAEDLARSLSDPRRGGWVSGYLAGAFWITADWCAVLHHARNAEQAAVATGDVGLRIQANYYLGLGRLNRGEHRTGEAHLRAALELFEGRAKDTHWPSVGSPAVLAHSWLGWSLGERGRFHDGILAGEAAARTAETLDQVYTRIHAYRNLAWVHVLAGDHPAAFELLERSALLCREWGVVFLSPVVNRTLGYLHALSGEVDKGIALLRDGLAANDSAGILAHQSLGFAQLAEACALAGRLEEARAFAERGVELARHRGERGYEAWALRALAEVRAKEPDGIGAEDAYHQARSLADELDMQPLVARCHVGLGQLHRRLGNTSKAAQHLAEAATRCRDMNVPFRLTWP